jgi:hypothetical protein
MKHVGASNARLDRLRAVLAAAVVFLLGACAFGGGAGAEPRAPRATDDGARRTAAVASVARPSRRPAPRVRDARFFCRLRAGTTRLPADRRRGLALHLRQYPDLGLATKAQAAAARRLLATLRTAAARLGTLRAARAAGYDVRTARRAVGDRTPHYLHAEHRRLSNDRRFFDPRRPEALIYANVPGSPPKLIGVMFSVPRGVTGPTVAGPIARWHFHRVCARGGNRGLTPPAHGPCPPGTTLGEGSEMLHVWFTRDLRSAFAIRAPQPELCSAGLLPRGFCTGGVRLAGM